jgi:hypothetical protein
MLPRAHIIVGLISSFILFLVCPQITFFYALIIFLASVLIDVDHYLYYAFRKKDLHLSRAYNWFRGQQKRFAKLKPSERSKYKSTIIIFHGIEFLLVLILLVIFINKIFLFILIGVIIHLFLDYYDLIVSKRDFYIKISQIYTHIKNKKKPKFI